MKGLDKKIDNIYCHINSGIIYRIDSNNSCDAIKISEDNCPRIVVDGELLWLYRYIMEGDTYSSGFSHYICDGEDITINKYYRDECIREIKKVIGNNIGVSYRGVIDLLDKYGFPDWMLVGYRGNVEGIEQIDLSEEYYNELRGEVIEDMIYKAAEEKANRYGFRIKNIEIEKI